MPVNSWFKLRIKQYYDGSEYLWKTFIDGQLVNSMVNNNATTFENVDGILGNQYHPGKFSIFKHSSWPTISHTLYRMTPTVWAIWYGSYDMHHMI